MCDQNKRGSLAWARLVLLALFAKAFLFASPILSAQTLDETRQQFLAGHYEDVIQTTSKKLADGQYLDGWRVLQVQSLLTVGRYAEAGSNALSGVDDFPSSIRLRLLARETRLYQNDIAGANRQLEEIKYIIQRRGRFEQDADSLVALGRALLMLGVEPRLALENCFQRACNADPPSRDGYLASGQLALDKHDFLLAADTFRAGLKKFPNDPDLESGLAQAFATGDGPEMLKHADAALAVNPKHIPSLLLLGERLIDAEKYDDAEKQFDIILEVNPFRPEALAYKAVLAHLRNDATAENQLRDKALKYWKTNPEVDFIIGRKLAQKYLFAEGAAAQRRSLAFEPAYVPATRELAEDLLRLGQTDEGWKLALDAHAKDEYDVTTYNLSQLHDQMAKFRTLTNADFIVRMSASEAQIYGDRVLDLLGRAKAALCAKYGVELTRPTVVEIFPEQKDFAVRTFGMPGNPGYLGVCFGSVITANSPASQSPNPANWEDVLWHEFCHVVTLNDTKNRMPRWLSEGISVYEERQADPAWGERMNLAYREMILNGKLTPLGELSGAFLQPKDGEALQFAYYESSLVVEFVVQKFGMDTLKQILLDLRDGKGINQAIADRTVPLPDLEKQFAAFVQAKADNLAPGVDLAKPPSEGGDAADTWEKLHRGGYYLQMKEARALVEEKKWNEARPRLESLAASYHGERRDDNPLWLLAVTQRNLNDTNAEWATLQKFAEQEADFVDLYLRLIDIAGARGDWSAESKYAARLLQINPLISAPYRALAQAAIATENNDQAIDAYRKILLLDKPDPAETHFQLAHLLHARGGAEGEAKRQVLQALEDAPRYRDAQRLLLEIEAASGNGTATASQTRS
jgi:tetratricopeptide (TPR) repeat protein